MPCLSYVSSIAFKCLAKVAQGHAIELPIREVKVFSIRVDPDFWSAGNLPCFIHDLHA